MTDPVKNEQDEAAPAPVSGEAAAAPAAEPRGDESGLAAAIEAVNAENAALKDRLLRAMAEVENMRRRTEREVADAKLYGVTAFARDMLTVADNLGRALDSIPEEARAGAEGALKSLIEGVELTMRDLTAALGRHGVRKLEPLGEKFDPNFHEALYEAPNEDLPAGTVAQVVQTGWRIGDRVLRPARVGVSKGGPKVVAKAE